MYLVWAEQGLANRLRTILTYLHLAEKAQAPLYCCWEADEHCPGLFQDYFEPLYRPIFGQAHWDHHMTLRDVISFRGQGYPTDIAEAHGVNLSDAQHTALYEKLVLKPELRSQIDAFADSVDIGSCIGLHIRRTDHVKDAVSQTGGYADDNQFMTQIEALIAQDVQARFFLATDNAETQQTFQDRFGERLVIYSSVPRSDALRKTSLRHAIFDVYLLSKCQRIFGSTYSSYSQLAHHLSGGRAPLEMLTARSKM
ncbi:MAG: hypothetical protein AAGI12_05230 [Pseudomonadota bacterium]